MNLPFQALLLVLLAAPGIFFRYAYRKFDHTRGPDSADVPLLGPTRETFFSLLAAGAVHGLLVHLPPGFGQGVDVHVVLRFLLDNFGHEQAALDSAIDAVASHPHQVFAYFAVAVLMGTALGMLAGLIVRLRWPGLDRRWGLLEYASPWTRLLRGESSGEPEGAVKPVATAVTCAMTVGGASFLYSGILRRFILDGRGHLVRLVLSEAFRRNLEDDLKNTGDRVDIASDPRYYPIEGDFLVLEYSAVHNMDLVDIIPYPADDEEATEPIAEYVEQGG